METGRPAEAEAILRPIAEAASDDREAAWLLSRAELQLGRVEPAVAWLERVRRFRSGRQLARAVAVRRLTPMRRLPSHRRPCAHEVSPHARTLYREADWRTSRSPTGPSRTRRIRPPSPFHPRGSRPHPPGGCATPRPGRTSDCRVCPGAWARTASPWSPRRGPGGTPSRSSCLLLRRRPVRRDQGGQRPSRIRPEAFLGLALSEKALRQCLRCTPPGSAPRRRPRGPDGPEAPRSRHRLRALPRAGEPRPGGRTGPPGAAIAVRRDASRSGRWSPATNATPPTGRSDPSDPEFTRFQGTTLKFSRCYTGSGGAIHCATCHDPHRGLDRTASHYEAKCLDCHAGEGGEVPARRPARSIRPPAASTATCRKGPGSELPARFTNHHIRVHRPIAEEVDGPSTPDGVRRIGPKSTAPTRCWRRSAAPGRASRPESVLYEDVAPRGIRREGRQYDPVRPGEEAGADSPRPGGSGGNVPRRCVCRRSDDRRGRSSNRPPSALGRRSLRRRLAHRGRPRTAEQRQLQPRLRAIRAAGGTSSSVRRQGQNDSTRSPATTSLAIGVRAITVGQSREGLIAVSGGRYDNPRPCREPTHSRDGRQRPRPSSRLGGRPLPRESAAMAPNRGRTRSPWSWARSPDSHRLASPACDVSGVQPPQSFTGRLELEGIRTQAGSIQAAANGEWPGRLRNRIEGSRPATLGGRDVEQVVEDLAAGLAEQGMVGAGGLTSGKSRVLTQFNPPTRTRRPGSGFAGPSGPSRRRCGTAAPAARPGPAPRARRRRVARGRAAGGGPRPPIRPPSGSRIDHPRSATANDRLRPKRRPSRAPTARAEGLARRPVERGVEGIEQPVSATETPRPGVRRRTGPRCIAPGPRSARRSPRRRRGRSSAAASRSRIASGPSSASRRAASARNAASSAASSDDNDWRSLVHRGRSARRRSVRAWTIPASSAEDLQRTAVEDEPIARHEPLGVGGLERPDRHAVVERPARIPPRRSCRRCSGTSGPTRPLRRPNQPFRRQILGDVQRGAAPGSGSKAPGGDARSPARNDRQASKSSVRARPSARPGGKASNAASTDCSPAHAIPTSCWQTTSSGARVIAERLDPPARAPPSP